MGRKQKFDRALICADFLAGIDENIIASNHGACVATIRRVVRALLPPSVIAPVSRSRRLNSWRSRSQAIQAAKVESGALIIEPRGEVVFATVGGVRFLLDAADEPLLRQYCWRLTNDNRLLRQVSDAGQRVRGNIYIYHDVLGVQPSRSQVVDHINRDPTDNRRSNLRVCSYSANAFNRGERRVHPKAPSRKVQHEDA